MYIKGHLHLIDCYFRETHSHCIMFCLPFIYDSTRTLSLATTFSTMISELKHPIHWKSDESHRQHQHIPSEILTTGIGHIY